MLNSTDAKILVNQKKIEKNSVKIFELQEMLKVCSSPLANVSFEDLIAEQENYIKILNKTLSDFENQNQEVIQEYYLWKAEIERLCHEFEYFKRTKLETKGFDERCKIYEEMIAVQKEKYSIFQKANVNIVCFLDRKGLNPDFGVIRQIQHNLEEATKDMLTYKMLFEESQRLEAQETACIAQDGSVIRERSLELDNIQIQLSNNIKHRATLEIKYPHFSLPCYAKILGIIDLYDETPKKTSEKATESDADKCKYLESHCNGASTLIPERALQQFRMGDQAKINEILQQLAPAVSASFVQEDGVFRIKMQGDSGVGKSSLILRMVDNVFEDCFICKLQTRVIYRQYQGQTVSLKLWDTRGEGIYDDFNAPICRDPHVILLCFDLTDKVTFRNLNCWLKEIEKYSSSVSESIILVGNKCDLIAEREISPEEVQNFAQEHGFPYFETSAKESIHCQELLAYSILNCLESHKEINQPQPVCPQQTEDISMFASIRTSAVSFWERISAPESSSSCSSASSSKTYKQ